MKKMTSLLIALIFAVGALACNSTPDVDNTVPDETNLWIYVIEKGYGVQWLEALADEFERRNEGVTVHVTATVNENLMIQSFDAGPTKNDYDIYFDTGPSVHSQLSVKSNKFEGYEQGLYDLTELYGTTIPGEEDTFGGKMNESIREIISVEEDGEEHFYSVPWTLGTTGINYSVELVESVLGADRQLPRTTEELYDFAKDFQNSAAEGQYAFAYPGGLDQWYAMLYTWWAQYEGLENYQNFFNAEYYDPVRGKMAVGPQIFNQQGRLKALEALEKLIRIEEGLHEKGINAYDVNTFRQLQTTFVVGEKYAMYPCGDWLAQESDDEDAKEIRFMKTPVISSIIDQNRTNNRLKVITTEPLLRLAVSVVDGELDRAELETAVAEEHPSYAATDLTADLKIIDEARHMVFSKAPIHTAYMPAYANATKLAKDFFLFMASDDGIGIYKQNVKGGFLPFRFDYSTLPEGKTLSGYEQSVTEVTENAVFIQSEGSKSPIFYKGGLLPFNTGSLGTVDGMLGADADSRYKRSASEIFELTKYDEAAWDLVLEKAGA